MRSLPDLGLPRLGGSPTVLGADWPSPVPRGGLGSLGVPVLSLAGSAPRGLFTSCSLVRGAPSGHPAGRGARSFTGRFFCGMLIVLTLSCWRDRSIPARDRIGQASDDDGIHALPHTGAASTTGRRTAATASKPTPLTRTLSAHAA